MTMTYSAALADHNVRKIRRDEGELRDVLGVRVQWKVKAKEMGSACSVYEMELAPGHGVPLHAFPSAQCVSVLDGAVDMFRVGSDGQQERLRCHAGESAQVPRNAPHGYRNGAERPARFLATSTYDPAAILTGGGMMVRAGDERRPPGPEEAQRFGAVAAAHQASCVAVVESGRLLEDERRAGPTQQDGSCAMEYVFDRRATERGTGADALGLNLAKGVFPAK
jgi:quercetin dioxygenase-like cupin family protein